VEKETIVHSTVHLLHLLNIILEGFRTQY